MAKETYTVRVNRPEGLMDWPWASNYFPRKIYYLRDAKKLAQNTLDHGAALVRIEFSKGGELDFRQGMKVK